MSPGLRRALDVGCDELVGEVADAGADLLAGWDGGGEVHSCPDAAVAAVLGEVGPGREAEHEVGGRGHAGLYARVSCRDRHGPVEVVGAEQAA